MGIEDIKQVCVVGAGTMGAQIAQQSALAGYPVVLTDVSEDQLKRAVESNRRLVMRRVDKGQLTPEQATDALNRVTVTTSLEEAAGNADFVFEAIVEQLQPKRDLFGRLDAVAKGHTIVATNSSTIPISKLADATQRPDRCINTHFFHPVLVMELCEVGGGPGTSAETVETTMELVRRIGRVPVLLEKEIDGFIVNRILHAASQEAMRLYEGGYADFDAIDLAVEKGLNWPMGPFKLADFSGVDITYNARREKYEASGDAHDRPAEFLRRMVEEGRLGRKTALGFYDYRDGGMTPAEDPRQL
ncbi:MAG: 3-hydroxyacyl-CoA dehydrogenase family protein [Candidatus Dormibacteraeota bacterium]|nr:3-hydroxyacyl-CoA dehydrogenase family protein [Candidatus Dormibacteraeota bacterium]